MLTLRFPQPMLAAANGEFKRKSREICSNGKEIDVND
jgi:hypothetical protein